MWISSNSDARLMTAYDIPVLRVPADLTSASVPAFELATRSHVATERSFLVFDLSSTRFISSAGLGHLIHVGRSLHEQGGALALAAGNRTIVKLLTTTGLMQVMPHFKTVRDAVGHLRGRRDAAG